MPNATGTEWEIGRRAGEWLLELALEAGKKLEIAFDYPDDDELLEAAIRLSGIWDRVRLVTVPVNVNAFTGCIAGKLAAEACFRELAEHGGRGLRRHHALADAMVLRAAYLAVKGAAQA